MKKIIYGLLITTSITESAVYASQTTGKSTTGQPMKTPSATTPMRSSTELKTDSSICPNQLGRKELTTLETGTITLGTFNFTLHTPLADFKTMMAHSTKHSVAKMDMDVPGRTIISTNPKFSQLQCTYTFSGITTKTKGSHAFSIVSEPTAVKSTPKKHMEPNQPSSNR